MVTKAIQVDEKTAEYIHKICAETGMGEGEALRKILHLQIQGDKPTTQERLARIREGGGNEGKGGMIDKMMELKALEKIGGGSDDGDDMSKEMREIRKMGMMMSAMQMYAQPQQQQQSQNTLSDKLTEAMLQKAISGDTKNGNSEVLEKLLEFQQQESEKRREDERERRREMESIFRDKELDGVRKEIARVQELTKEKDEEKKDELHQRMDMLQDSILRLGQSEDPLTKQVETRLKEKLTNALTDAVSDFDITSKKESITTDEGKINTNKIVSEAFRTLNRGIEAYGKKAPPQQTFQGLTPEQVAEIQAQQAEAQGVPDVGDAIPIQPKVQDVDPSQPEAPPETEILENPSVEFSPSQPASVEPAPTPAPESEQPKPEKKETKLQKKRREKIERVKGKKS